MPRNSRQHSDTGVYHVMLRGIDRHDIFADDQDRGKFLNVLRAVVAPKDNDGNPLPPYCRIHAYCLMDNHVHLLIAASSKEPSLFSLRTAPSSTARMTLGPTTTSRDFSIMDDSILDEIIIIGPNKNSSKQDETP